MTGKTWEVDWGECGVQNFLLLGSTTALPSLEDHQHSYHTPLYASSVVKMYFPGGHALGGTLSEALKKTRNKGGRREKGQNGRTKVTHPRYIRRQAIPPPPAS